MSVFSLTVNEHILLILNDLNEAKDVFPLKEINTIDHYPIFQALIVCKKEGFIDIEDELTPVEIEGEPAHRKIQLTYSPILTMKGLLFLNEKTTDLEKTIEKLSSEYISETINKRAEKGDAAAQKIKDTSNFISDVENIRKNGSSLVGVAVKIYEHFKDFF